MWVLKSPFCWTLFADRKEVVASVFFEHVQGLLRQDSLAESVESVVCYGIGSFSRARTSQYQLALLLAIRAQLVVRPFALFLFPFPFPFSSSFPFSLFFSTFPHRIRSRRLENALYLTQCWFRPRGDSWRTMGFGSLNQTRFFSATLSPRIIQTRATATTTTTTRPLGSKAHSENQNLVLHASLWEGAVQQSALGELDT